MDRDMVNCLHYLYQWHQLNEEQVFETDPQKKLFWCEGDTVYPLMNKSFISHSSEKNQYSLLPAVYDLVDTIEDQLRTLPKPDFSFGYPISAPIRSPGAIRPAFLAISYETKFDEVKKTILDAAKLTNFDCEVTGDLLTSGDIMDQVWQGIRGSDVVIADITNNNTNVFYEIGLAHALGKEVIILSQYNESPFDIRSHRRLTYQVDDLNDLKNKLVDAFKSVSARYPHEGDEPRF